ncbi:MAG: pyridoxamine 5'-phosphate oxidase family protein [Acidobacteria bacterium]|nr:pyridoxamine 5'-phosphate oxidase family protein [Acidobacteriota bacterium]
MSNNEFKQTERNRVRRLAKRGSYDRETVYAILDANYLCHLGFAVDGQPYVIPTLYGRVGDVIYVHGSNVSRMLGQAAGRSRLCLTVTMVDDLVLARSAFHHSINYRSAVVFGTGEAVSDDSEKMDALKAISDSVLKGRWKDARLPNQKELDVTTVVRITIEEASAKARTGMPIDDAEDMNLPIWAGLVPVETAFGEPVADTQLLPGIELPDYLA